MTKTIQAPIVMVIAVLLAAGLLVFTNLSNDSSSTGNSSATSSTANTAGGQSLVVIPQGLVINEFMADNDRAVESVFGGHPDWLELYNSGDTSIDLSGMYLSDSLSKASWRFPNGTTILPHSYLIIWADADAGRAQLQTNFNLKANGGVIALYAQDRQTLIDFVIYHKQIRDVSYGRLPDGGSSWDYMTSPTAGRANVANPRKITLASWEVWLFITIALAICVVAAFKHKFHFRRKR
ncbi:MAG: lamin tail domain-containing protein [Candidatus Bathyarchaeota archaeon]|jgi:hypothetical protein|nr:lamin tail domain-containing protein [Candidatus Bathyarchaeota archaeon]